MEEPRVDKQEMDEKKVTEKIRQSAEQISVPDSLSPENIKKKLEEQSQKNGKKAVAGRFGAWRRYGVRAAELAAAAALVFVAGHQMGVMQTRKTALSKTEMDVQTIQAQESVLEQETAADENGIDEMPMMKKLFTAPQQSEAGAKAAEDQAAKAQAAEDQAAEAKAAEDQAAEAKAAEDQAAEVQAAEAQAVEGIAPIGSVEELYNRLVEYQRSNNEYGVKYNTMAIKDEVAVPEMAVEMDSAPQAVQGGGDYSETNIRQLGVDESDIIKTDGEYIYILKQNSSVKIVSADGEQLALTQSIIPADLSVSVRDMYVSGDTLNVITSGSKSSMIEEETDVYVTQDYDFAQVWTYDITDRTEPKLLGCAEQEGYYHSSRKVGDYVYLFTQFYPEIKDTLERDDIMPLVNGAAMEANDIYVPETLQSTAYLVIGSVDVRRPSELFAHKAVVSGVNNFYVSADSIFICNQSWKDGKDITEIMKFAYKDGDIRGVGICSLEGYLNDTFSLDEYNGYLRVVATNWNSGDEINALYVYDGQMNLVGKIADIAPGETIRSARFLGDTGYFVTFRQTDPLFSVDLSDPADPKILGELKVTGFSSYLHFYGKDRLLGIGYDADSESGSTTGIKLSMFDISDPANVTEIKRYVIKDANYCPGLSNYKSILIDPEKNLFGFVCDNNYLVFSYDEQEGFQNKLTYNMSEGSRQTNYWYSFDDVRGLYIADTFYLANPDVIRAFDMADGFVQEAKLEL